MRKDLFLLIVFAIVVGCPKHGNQWTEHIARGEYWYSHLDFEAGAHHVLEFKLIDGGPVDVLFMDQTGFDEFQNRIALDTVISDTFNIPVETYSECHTSAVEHEEYEYCVFWSWDTIALAPVDVYVMNYDNFVLYQNLNPFDYYVRYDSVVYVLDTIEASSTEELYFVIDNTSSCGSIPVDWAHYGVLISKLVLQEFNFFENISVPNTDDILYNIEIPVADTLYLVVNNAGYVEGGAIPVGPVDFEIIIKDE